MVFDKFLIICLFVCHINLIAAIVYKCNKNAECGCSRTDANVYKIVGGEDAFPLSWGWAVSFQRSPGDHFCTGSIISPTHVVTAAHCFPDDQNITAVNVVVGIDNLKESNLATAYVRSIGRVTLHPGYNPITKVHDIAVVELNESLTISNETVLARLCLPHIEPSHREPEYPADSVSLVAIGWGLLSANALWIPDDQNLQQVTVQSVSVHNETCREFVANSSFQFCAGVDGGGKDTCQGDSGGPLMRFEPTQKQWVLAGVTSFGLGCADPRYSGVYTRASAYRAWLNETTKNGFRESLVDLPSAATDNNYNIYMILLSLIQFCFISLRN